MKINMPVTGTEVPIPEGVYLVSQTNLKGVITDANEAFVAVSGFSREELMGQSHNIVRHPDMPPAAFADMWRCLKAGLPWRGFVKNRCKNGDYYWVDALVVPIQKQRQTIGYMSVRRAPSKQQVNEASQLYAQLGKDGRFSSIKTRPLSLKTQFNLLFAAIAIPIILNVLVMQFSLPAWLDMFTGILALLPLLPLALLVNLKVFKPLSEVESKLQLLSEGDLAERYDIQKPNEIGRIANAFSVMQTRWLVSIDHIQEATGTSMIEMEQVNREADQMNDHINTQHDRISAVAAATEEFCQAVAEVASCSADTSRAALTSGERIATGRSVVEAGMRSAREAVTAVQGTREKITQLNDAVVRINTVTQVIKEIAEQTNLLALNAAIEAARAGETGRGFAVVADEVRKLAERTAGSTGEINQMVTDVLRLATEVDAVMDETAATVDKSTQHMQESVSCFASVEAASQESVNLSGHIAEAAEQQAEAEQEVARNMEQIASLSETNQQGIEKLWTSVSRMLNAINHIEQSLAVFRLFSNQGSAANNKLALSARLSVVEQIDKAIAAHSAWRGRLSSMIQSGASDVPVSSIKANDQCAFGKWLNSTSIPSHMKDAPRYRQICDLHSHFHSCAGEIAEKACTGKRAEATAAMQQNDTFQKTSTELVSMLENWKREMA